MNFVLIPFFLAANVTVDDVTDWTHGPEYIFHVKLTYLLSDDLLEEPLFGVNPEMIMKCRPKTPDKLFCRFEGLNEDSELETPSMKLPFLIKFNQRGIESLQFPEIIDGTTLNVIRCIVKELSIGADLVQHANALPAFVAKQSYMFGDCTTLFTVLEYDKDQSVFMQDEEKGEQNYDLQMLSLQQKHPDSIVVVEKRTEHRRCDNPTDAFYDVHRLDVKATRSVSKMRISADTFKSRTEMHIKFKKLGQNVFFTMQKIATVELAAIVPAKEPLPYLEFDKVASPRFFEVMEHNFLT